MLQPDACAHCGGETVHTVSFDDDAVIQLCDSQRAFVQSVCEGFLALVRDGAGAAA